MMSRPVHRITSTASLNIHICLMPETVSHLCQLTCLMVNCLLLLPRYTAITGYRISSTKSNNKQQPTAGYQIIGI